MKSARRALILLSGEIPDAGIVRRAARGCGVVICADGALRGAARLRLKPDFVVGDMDSLPRLTPGARRAVFWCDFDRNRSDFEKCLDFARHIGQAEVVIAGALGGRTDHAQVNWALAAHAARSGLGVTILDSQIARNLGPGALRLELSRRRPFSLLAATPRATVSLSGSLYPLSRHLLTPGSRGLSNVALGRARLTVHSGRIWFFSEYL